MQIRSDRPRLQVRRGQQFPLAPLLDRETVAVDPQEPVDSRLDFLIGGLRAQVPVVVGQESRQVPDPLFLLHLGTFRVEDRQLERPERGPLVRRRAPENLIRPGHVRSRTGRRGPVPRDVPVLPDQESGQLLQRPHRAPEGPVGHLEPVVPGRVRFAQLGMRNVIERHPPGTELQSRVCICGLHVVVRFQAGPHRPEPAGADHLESGVPRLALCGTELRLCEAIHLEPCEHHEGCTLGLHSGLHGVQALLCVLQARVEDQDRAREDEDQNGQGGEVESFHPGHPTRDPGPLSIISLPFWHRPTKVAPMTTNQHLFDESNEATYCPEDDKLRLYVGRVPREEYLALRKEGWTSTPKQDCDFVATWTPARRDTAIAYAGVILDEDMGPDERAADRAERFGGYRDKRLDEAGAHADRYDSQPIAHGFQSQARAEKAAARHDRIADRAVDAWSKAEYWTSRTAGVIRHALHRSSPGVRMGRIKTLEAEMRRLQARYTPTRPDRIISPPYGGGEPIPHVWCGAGRGGHWVPEADLAAIREGVAEWETHLRLRLAYENQMLEAQGGRLEQQDVEVGGRIGSKLILRANKSPKTGRITSVALLGPRIEGWAYKARNIPGTEWAEYQFETERLSPGDYTPPTPESLAELKQVRSTIRGKAPKRKPCPLVNPTPKAAERLQQALNGQYWERYASAIRRQHGHDPKPFERPGRVVEMTQAAYSARSKGAGICETRTLHRGPNLGAQKSDLYSSAQARRMKAIGDPVCKVRLMTTGRSAYAAPSIVVLTDKPQKPLPEPVWEEIPAPDQATA